VSEEHLTTLKRALATLEKMQKRIETLEQGSREPIALIGIGCRFPGGANTPEAFWQMLNGEVDAVREVPANRWTLDEFYAPESAQPGKVSTRYGSFLDNIEDFDPTFFGLNTDEARHIDPQQRLLLEVAWEAIEDSGQIKARLKESKTGVFVGMMSKDYAKYSERDGHLTAITKYYCTGNDFSFTAGRLSYVLGLQGPNMAIDTACSSSLVAIHLACQSLRNGECDMALAGGVSLMLTPHLNIFLSQIGSLSPDGHCRTFSAQASGTGRGEGCGVVVLKRLSTALAHHDRICAVITGSAVNHSGTGGGFTIPNGHAQQEVMRRALANARTLPQQVGYVEAHGTGTLLGDPIEVEALGAVYSEGHTKEQPLVIGSAKTHIGHLDPAAGIAGLIKTVLILQNGIIPRHLHADELNPYIPWQKFPIMVSREAVVWSPEVQPRTAAVSAFGLSGTNAHAIVQEFSTPQLQKKASHSQYHLMTLSAHNDETLRAQAKAYSLWLRQDAATAIDLADICYTTTVRRTQHDYRLAVTGRSHAEMAQSLTAYLDGQTVFGLQTGSVVGPQSEGANNAAEHLLPSLCNGQDERASMLAALGALYCTGQPVDWSNLYPDGRQVALPAYAWQRIRLWLPPQNGWSSSAPASIPQLDVSSRPSQLLLLSARSEAALDSLASNLAAYLQQHPAQHLADIAYTLQTAESDLEYRQVLLCRDREDAYTALQNLAPYRSLRSCQPGSERPVAFLLAGTGEQYPGMARELYEREKTFREIVDYCCQQVQRSVRDSASPLANLRQFLLTGMAERTEPSTINLRTLMRRRGGHSIETEKASSPPQSTASQRSIVEELRQTELAQPVSFIIEYALAQLLIEWGLQPQALLGYSLGEYVAACLAGVLSLQDALTLVVRRAQLIQALPQGSMIAVMLPESELTPYLNTSVELAIVNSPQTCVLAGPDESIQEVEQHLRERQVAYQRIQGTHAFHSSMLAPLRIELTTLARSLTFNPPRIPYLSNVTGTWITATMATDPAYWAEHMCQTVRFREGLGHLLQETNAVLLEIGPGQTLASFAHQHPACINERLFFATLPARHEEHSEQDYLLTTLSKLWLCGVRINWYGFHAHEQRQHVFLPTFPQDAVNKNSSPREESVETLHEQCATPIPQPLASTCRPRPTLEVPYVAPSNALQQQLATLWAQTLGIEQVGIHDNFFDLGGNSLMGVKLVISLRAMLGNEELPVYVLYEAPSISVLADYLEHNYVLTNS
jgi:acyl transferase domain-containing protein